jgi:hypothetical protein
LLSIIDEKDTGVQWNEYWNHLKRDGEYLISYKHCDSLKESFAISYNFEWDSNVTELSNWQLENRVLHSISTNVEAKIICKSLHTNLHS